MTTGCDPPLSAFVLVLLETNLDPGPPSCADLHYLEPGQWVAGLAPVRPLLDYGDLALPKHQSLHQGVIMW